MPYSKKELAELVTELNAPKIVRVCDKHLYAPGGRNFPTSGCKACGMAFWMWFLKETPPEKRREKLEELQQLAHHMAEEEDKGTLDIRLFPYPIMTRDKGN